MRRRSPCVSAMLGLLLFTSGLTAQEARPTSLSRIAVELTVGPSHSRGSGEYIGSSETALSGDALLALRLLPVAGGQLVLAASAASRLTPRTTTLECIIDAQGECMDHFPIFQQIVGHVGWEDAEATKRVLAGLAIVDSEVAGASVGWQIRFEAARPVSSHVAFVLGVRAMLVPNHREDTFGIFSGGMGFRMR